MVLSLLSPFSKYKYIKSFLKIPISQVMKKNSERLSALPRTHG